MDPDPLECVSGSTSMNNIIIESNQAVLRILLVVTLMQLRILLATFMRIRIRILL
jgi:hypothetical protein